jgi:hypothetical protein
MSTESGDLQPKLALYDSATGFPLALPPDGQIEGIEATVGGTWTLLAFSEVDETGVYRLSIDVQPGPKPCDGDINEDGEVNVQDLLIVVLQWGPCP